MQLLEDAGSLSFKHQSPVALWFGPFPFVLFTNSKHIEAIYKLEKRGARKCML